MEAVEFIRQKARMCDYYYGAACIHNDSGETCPAQSIDCGITTDEPEQLVAIVEKWAKDHPEETSAATSHKSDEPCVKTIQDNLEGAIYHAIASNKTQIEKLEYDVYVVRHTLAALHDKIFALSAKIDYTPTMESSQTQEPKRTNKHVLLTAFPNARVDINGIPDMCPLVLDSQYDCNAFASCSLCKRTHWLAEVEE